MSGKKFPRILNFKNLDFEKIEYYNPQRDKEGCLISNVYYKFMNNNPLSIYLETPKLKTTTGIIKNGNDYYIELELSIEGYNSSFYEFIEKVDEKNIMSCHYNSNEWFNKQLPLNTIEEFYKSPIKVNFNNNNPTMIFKIPTIKGKMLLEVYNQQKQLININKLCAGDELSAIIRFNGLRFLKQEFIAEWEIYKIKLFKTIDEDNLPSGYFFSDDTIQNVEVDKNNDEEQDNNNNNNNNVFFNLNNEPYETDTETIRENEANIINDNILQNKEEDTLLGDNIEQVVNKQSVNEPVIEPVIEPVNEPVNESVNEPVNEQVVNEQSTNEQVVNEQTVNEQVVNEHSNNEDSSPEKENIINIKKDNIIDDEEDHKLKNDASENYESDDDNKSDDDDDESGDDDDESDDDEYEFTDSEYELEDDDDELNELKLN